MSKIASKSSPNKKDRLHHPPSLKVCLGLCTVAVTWQVLSTSATALLSRFLKLADFHNQSPLLTMVEIKRVTSKDGESREDILCILGIYKRNKEKIVLNTNHKYFYQLQQQLFCSKYKQSHFAVSDGVWLNHELVEFNDGFWGGPLQELEKFYF